MSDQREIWSSLINGQYSQYRLRKVMWGVASGLSQLIGRTVSNDDPVVERVVLDKVQKRAGGPEEKMVGIYLVIGGACMGRRS